MSWRGIKKQISIPQEIKDLYDNILNFYNTQNLTKIVCVTYMYPLYDLKTNKVVGYWSDHSIMDLSDKEQCYEIIIGLKKAHKDLHFIFV